MASVSKARAALRGGDRQQARELCAAVLVDVQPVIIAYPELLREVLHVLMIGHGFRILSRLIIALTGYRLQILLLSGRAVQVAVPKCYQDGREATCTVDPRWLATLTPDDPFLRRWAQAISAGRALPTEPATIVAQRLSAEPV